MVKFVPSERFLDLGYDNSFRGMVGDVREFIRESLWF